MGSYKGPTGQPHRTWKLNTGKSPQGQILIRLILSLTGHLPCRNTALRYCPQKEIYANIFNMLNKTEGSHEQTSLDAGYSLTIPVSMGHNLEKESCLIAFWIELGHCGISELRIYQSDFKEAWVFTRTRNVKLADLGLGLNSTTTWVLTVWPWTNNLSFLNVSFLIHRIEMIFPTSQSYFKDWDEPGKQFIICKAFSTPLLLLTATFEKIR